MCVVILQSPPKTCSGLVIKQQCVTCECPVFPISNVPAGLVPAGNFWGLGVCMFCFLETGSHLAQVGLRFAM